MNRSLDYLLDNIKIYGNKHSTYIPFDGCVCYPLNTIEFIRTGFMDISPSLNARDYKDPKCVVIKVS